MNVPTTMNANERPPETPPEQPIDDAGAPSRLAPKRLARSLLLNEGEMAVHTERFGPRSRTIHAYTDVKQVHVMEVEEEKCGTVLVLVPVGKVNSANARMFESVVMDRISGGEQHMVVDFSRLDFITSAGIRVLLLAAKALRAVNGTLVLCAMKRHVQEVFRISGCDRIMQIEESRRAALGSARAEGGR